MKKKHFIFWGGAHLKLGVPKSPVHSPPPASYADGRTGFGDQGSIFVSPSAECREETLRAVRRKRLRAP